MPDREWWTCPQCRGVLGEIVGDKVLIKHRPVEHHRPDLGYEIELEIPRVSGVKRRCDTRRCRAGKDGGWMELEAVSC